MIASTITFISCLVLTLVCLGAAVITGKKSKRRKHLTAVSGAVVMLVATIWAALELGVYYDLDSAGWITPVHMGMARVNTAAYLLPVITGLRTIKNPAGRGLHGKVAWCILLLTVGTAATGVLMLLWSEPI